MEKKAALELSIGTIVIIVIAISMLILGIVLVRTIFVGAKHNIDVLNDKVRSEINKLFTGDQKMVFYLAGRTVKVSQGEIWGVAFGVKNLEATVGSFTYRTEVAEVSSITCSGKTRADAEGLIILGKSGSLGRISSGGETYGLVKFDIPEGFPLGCEIRYNVEIKKDGALYDTGFFDIQIRKRFIGIF